MSETATPPDIAQTVIDLMPEGLPRRIVDGMSEYRIKEGPRLAEHLDEVPPEERTWLMAFKTAAKGSTDFWDGLFSDWIGPTETGRDLDREGDRKFVMSQQKVLAKNGEVPAIHYQLKVFREGTMKGLRWWGERNGKSLKSLQVNRAKTVVEMSHLSWIAHSPLSQNEDLMRWGASMGTGLSLTGLAETIFTYMKNEGANVDTPRNSTARQKTAGSFGSLAGFIKEKLPWMTASHLTKLGKIAVESAAVMAVASPDHPVLPTTIYTLGSLADAADGALARARGESGSDGMIEDVEADLEQQIATMAALSVIAMRRGNRVAAANYALAAMLTPLSALTRAQAEGRGLIVAEGGMGTRVGRGILGGVGMGLNRYRDASDIVSAMLAAGTADTVYERRDVVSKGKDSEYCVGENHDPEIMRDAELREAAIRPYAEIGIAVGSLLLAANSSEAIQSQIPKVEPKPGILNFAVDKVGLKLRDSAAVRRVMAHVGKI